MQALQLSATARGRHMQQSERYAGGKGLLRALERESPQRLCHLHSQTIPMQAALTKQQGTLSIKIEDIEHVSPSVSKQCGDFGVLQAPKTDQYTHPCMTL